MFLRHFVPPCRGPFPGVVERVVDADTVQCWARVALWDYPAYPMVRLAGVDAPEIFHPQSPAEQLLGQKAAAFARAVLTGQPVSLLMATTPKDDHDRWVCGIVYRDARGVQVDYGSELIRRRLTKADVPVFAAATPEEQAAWGALP